jgi:hypothetical protein
MISDSERQQLTELIGKSDCQDNTEFIRNTKPSSNIMKDVRRLEALSNEQETLRLLDPENYLELCKKECNFLYTHYTEIFNKLLKDELDLTIMARFVVILKMIEDNVVDQHEGSVLVGKILKELYLDSAIKRSDKLDKQYPSENKKQEPTREISWKQYRKMNP